MTNLTELKKLAEAATPGSWTAYDDTSSTGRIEIVAIGKTLARIYRSVPAEDWPNAAFIAAANPQTILQMISVMEQMADALEYGFVDDKSQHKERDALAVYKELSTPEAACLKAARALRRKVRRPVTTTKGQKHGCARKSVASGNKRT